MSVINSIPLIAAGDDGYQISRSVRLRSSASAYFNRTPSTTGTGGSRVWTYSFWVKRGKVGVRQVILDGYAASAGHEFEFQANDTIEFGGWGAGAAACQLDTTQVFRDPSAWYHITLAADTTQATAANRIKLYVNGSQVTSFTTATYPSQNALLYIGSNVAQNLGRRGDNQFYLDGYLTEVNFIDGQALTPSSFGETDAVTGVWKPKKYAGTYGTNGFYLNFSDNSAATAAAIGKDWSGNGNNWTPNNISVTAGVTYDSMLDVPTMYADGGNGRGNYAVVSPIDMFVNTSGVASDGNLVFTSPVSAGVDSATTGTVGSASGSWYYETTITQGSPNTNAQIGVLQSHTNSGFGSYSAALNFYTNATTSSTYKNGSSVQTGLTACSAGDVLGVAFDATNNTIQFYRNGSAYGSQVTGLTSGTYVPFVYAQTSGTGTRWILTLNFGQRPFAYTPPTGFKALNTQNLPEATIKKGNQYFDVTTYTGDGSSTRAVSLSIAPDLLWLKNRTAANDHILIDTVRGGTAPAKTLFSNLTNAEFTTTGAFNNYGYVDSLSGSTLNVVKGTQTSSYTNYLNSAYVGWQWKESASAGFDIVTFTSHASGSASFNHGLGVAPKMVIYKIRTTATDWFVYHDSIGATKNLRLNATSAESIQTAPFNNTAPTSTQFTLGTTFAGSLSMVAYLFAEVAGFSAFGKYTGNGSADGPMVYLGFRPRFVMIKCSSSTGYWIVEDSSRNLSNAVDAELFANDSLAEYDANRYVDFLSNGFKIRHSDPTQNSSGATYIYAAFAENPTKYSLAR